MPEYGSIKKKPKKGERKRKAKNSAVVSAYSEEGKERARKDAALNRASLFLFLLLLVGGLVAVIVLFSLGII